MSRRITLSLAASLDGFIARRDGSTDWLAAFGAREGLDERIPPGVDTAAMGRKAYDRIREGNGLGAFAGCRCIVFSRRRREARERRVRFVADDPADYLRELRAQAGGGIWLVGGGELARVCLEAGLVSTVMLSLVPVLLGDGVPLFLPRGGTTWLRLRESVGEPNGRVRLRYDAIRKPTGAPPLERVENSDARTDTLASHPAQATAAFATAVGSRDAAFAVGAAMVRAWSVRRRAA